MKRIILIIGIIIAVAAAAAVIFILTASPNHNPKFSKDEIIFTTITDSNGEFLSNYKYVSNDPTYEVYKIKISNTKNVAFENPYVEHSGNVFVNSTDSATGIEISFQITSGTDFYFEIQSDNFETATMMYHAREYIQADSLNLKIATSPTGPFTDFYASNNSIYIIPSQYKNAALLDGFPSELWVIPSSTTHPGANFAVSVAESGHLQLLGNEAPYRLAPKSAGASMFNFYAQDGSGTSKSVTFVCKHVTPTGISGLPNKIDIDLSESAEYLLQNFTVLPLYAQNYILEFESSNKNIFTITNNTITAQAVGMAKLWVKIDGEVTYEIPVNIQLGQLPKFTFALNSFTVENFGNDITLSGTNLSLNIANVAASFVSITINVGVDNFGGELEDINANINDENGMLYTPAGEPSFEFGGANFLTYTIYLSKTVGSLSIEFSKIIDEKPISKTLVITIVSE
ncbi:MAG: hypothetical protein J6A98_02995 [Clostridia bacterium]|nr:hypothetical protein [Clostridia bacterium]